MSTQGGGGRLSDGRGRTALVVGDGIELAVALRDRLDRAYLTVCDVRPAEALAAAGACRPWPWMVIGDSAGIGEPVACSLAQHPVLLLWRDARPTGLPPHARAFERFSELAGSLEAALSAEVGGIRLAPGGGLTMADGAHSGNAALEALVANHPHPVFAPRGAFRGAVIALASHRVPFRLARHGGGVSLVSSARGA